MNDDRHPMSIRQALLIGPCSHTFPLCRTYGDFEKDIEVEPTDADVDFKDR